MPNSKTNETYAALDEQIKAALSLRNELRQKQTDIDEQLDDVNRVILALERSIRTLKPFTETRQPEFRKEDMDAEAMRALNAMAISEGKL